MSTTEYREFRISFVDDFVEVSRVGSPPFMSFKNPASFSVSYAGISTGWGSEGDWEFCGFGKQGKVARLKKCVMITEAVEDTSTQLEL